MLEKNHFALDNAQQLLKQMEVEATDYMTDDNVRRRVSNLCAPWCFILYHYCKLTNIFPCQMTKHKSEFDKVRKQIRKLQRDGERRNVMGGNDSLVSISIFAVRSVWLALWWI